MHLKDLVKKKRIEWRQKSLGTRNEKEKKENEKNKKTR